MVFFFCTNSYTTVPITGILEPHAIVGIKFRGDKLIALQKRNDEIMQQLEAMLIEDVKHHGVDSTEANRIRTLITKRSEDLKKAYRGVTVELADLHDRPERMFLKNAVQVSMIFEHECLNYIVVRVLLQHVVDLASSRNLFNQIFSLETAKVHMCET
ncbi:unnamed protein product [Angiostrongylus costaricensis]|uniref:Carboxyl_trans domain-containing protein n=1 Tax=Angiostrongylus costaricensis TaxID=334426 RepID=A0A0R3PEH9_ANGCS|nr:unnamed protein product [Angiostrongylus costaricensis]